MMRILVSRRAALAAVITSLPFVGVALYFGIQTYYKISESGEADFFYFILICLLGSPLTLIWTILLIGFNIQTLFIWSIGNDLHNFIVPIYIVLWEIQWIIWSQIIAILVRKEESADQRKNK